MSMPRRSALLLTTIAAFFLVTSLVYFSSGSTARNWDVPAWRSGSGSQTVAPHPPNNKAASATASDQAVLQGLKISAPFEFRSVCFNVTPTEGVRRTSLDEVHSSLFARAPREVLSTDDGLPPCEDVVDLEVPYFDPGEHADTRALMLGMATLLKRVHDSLPALSRWLSDTGSPLVILLVDQTNLTTERKLIEEVHAKAANLGIEIIFEPYGGSLQDTEGLKNFALAEILHRRRREETRWFGIIDDDTFFLSLPPVLDALKPYDPRKEWYIGALTEGLFRIAKEGFKAWGGAGFFVSPPVMAKLAVNSERCKKLDRGFGDVLWRDCIQEVTSPTVPLTQLAGLHQIDVWGDISGWYETGWSPLLTVHHWKSWHFHDIPMAHTVSDVVGPEAFLQRYLFDDRVVLTNGFSIVYYPNGLPDLNLTELTFAEEVSQNEKPGRLMFAHSLGVTRPALERGKDKIGWTFTLAGYGDDGSVKQFYVKRRNKEVAGSKDSVIEIEWQRT